MEIDKQTQPTSVIQFSGLSSPYPKSLENQSASLFLKMPDDVIEEVIKQLDNQALFSLSATSHDCSKLTKNEKATRNITANIQQRPNSTSTHTITSISKPKISPGFFRNLSAFLGSISTNPFSNEVNM